MIYLLDTDLGGTDSIQDLIDSKKITYIPISSFPDYEHVITELIPRVGPDDLVILDTLSSLANTVRGDLKLGTETGASLWDKRNVYFADKNYLNVYEAAGQMIMRRLKNLRARGARIITTCHEDDHRDDISMTKKRAPALNEAFYKALMAASSDVFPLSVVLADEVDNNGVVKLKAGTRILNLKLSDDYVTKHHTTREVSMKLPRGIKDPTLPKLYGVLGKRPSWLVVYGPPGAGKTSLACSEVEEVAAPPKPAPAPTAQTPPAAEVADITAKRNEKTKVS